MKFLKLIADRLNSYTTTIAHKILFELSVPSETYSLFGINVRRFKIKLISYNKTTRKVSRVTSTKTSISLLSELDILS